jgi:hypothetical protein
VAIVATVTARAAPELGAVNRWLRDAPCDTRELAFDPERRVVELPFEQETAVDPALGLPARELARTRLLYREYRQPYVRCALRVGTAREMRTERVKFDPSGWIYGVRHDPSAGVVFLDLGLGDEPEVAVAVDELDVVVEVSDAVVSVRPRGIGRLLPWDS